VIVSGRGQTGLEVRDVLSDLILADVADRPCGLGELRLRSGVSTSVGVRVDLREQIAISAVGEARQDNIAGRRPVGRLFEDVAVVELESGGAGAGGVPVRAVVRSGRRGA